eukprot:scaffold2353_cov167-Amphora_coffeaeformis.AAC.28
MGSSASTCATVAVPIVVYYTISQVVQTLRQKPLQKLPTNKYASSSVQTEESFFATVDKLPLVFSSDKSGTSTTTTASVSCATEKSQEQSMIPLEVYIPVAATTPRTLPPTARLQRQRQNTVTTTAVHPPAAKANSHRWLTPQLEPSTSFQFVQL